MKNFLCKLFIVFLLLSSNRLLAQKQNYLLNDTSRDGTILYRRYNTSINPHPASAITSLLRSSLHMPPEDSLKVVAINSDQLGFTHIFYQQFYKGIKVEYATYTVQTRNGVVVEISGNFAKVGHPAIKPKLIEQQSLQFALKYVNAQKYRWEVPEEEKTLKTLRNDSNATYYPKGELVICYDYMNTKTYRLAYKFAISAYLPLSSNYIFVDAINGNIIAKQNLLYDGNATGSADTRYSGTQTITTDQFVSGGQTKYRLRESRNGVELETFNSQRTQSTAQVDFVDNDNNWTAAEYHDSLMDDAALDAHWAEEKIYDYWNTIRERNSYDSSGGSMITYVHYNKPYETLNGVPLYHSGWDNSQWDANLHVVDLGDGITQFTPLTSLDVCAHEFAHGFTQFAQRPIEILSNPDTPEAIALDEGISDIWGAVIENWVNPYGYTWEIGEQIMKDGYPCLRSLENPKTGGDPTGTAHGGYPDTYHGQYWDYNNASHTNCTVLDHWFYLLSEGGSGTNDLGNSYHVDGIGIDKAADIVWRAERYHLHPGSNYAGAREAMISATADLYGGTCSNEAVQVEEAWYAVGVGDAPPFIYISGDSAFCSSSTYSLSETDGGTVTWSASPSGIVTLTPSGSSVTATKITKGNATLTATLTRTCGNLTLTRDISTDPQVTSITATDQGCYNGYESWALTANPNMSNVTNWQWKVDNPNPNYPIYIESPNSQSTNVEVQGGGGISVTYQDACGETSERNGITVYSGSCSYSSITISPNPATNTITITNQSYNQNHFLKTIPTAEKNATLGLAYIKEVKVYDITGRLREEKTFSGKMNQVQIDVSGLTPGMYILKISDGKFTEQQKTVIQ